MADSTVIVQHIASVAIFCCSFVETYQEKVSPVSLVSLATFCTVLGWALWDYWIGQEEAEAAKAALLDEGNPAGEDLSSASSTASSKEPQGLGLVLPNGTSYQPGHSHSTSATSVNSDASNNSKTDTHNDVVVGSPNGYHSTFVDPGSSRSPRNQQRLATAKSAVLIYCALLGLSPILKSLTKSTSDDSIWAISTFLLCMNVAFFDYRGGTGARCVKYYKMSCEHVLSLSQPSSIHFYQLGIDGVHCTGLSSSVYKPSIFSHTILHRGLWSIPNLPAPAA